MRFNELTGNLFLYPMPVHATCLNHFTQKFLAYWTSNSFFIFPATCSEIETEISQLKTGKSVGPSSIPVYTIKTYISKPLEIVFNASLSTDMVPSDFKIAAEHRTCVQKRIKVLLVQLPPYLPHFCL